MSNPRCIDDVTEELTVRWEAACREIDRLTRELAEAKQYGSRVLLLKCAELEAGRDRLRDALARYGQHEKGCLAVFGAEGDQCSCGFAEHCPLCRRDAEGKSA